MSKRPREGEGPEGPPSPAADEDIGALAGWCDQKLRDEAQVHIDNFPGPDCTNQELEAFGDGTFEDFIEALEEEQRLTVPESKKGNVAGVWRECVADSTRMLAFTEQFERSSFSCKFNLAGTASRRLRDIKKSCVDNVDEWFFSLGHTLAEEILSNGAEEASSDSDDSDEPVEEDDSEDEEEGESSSASGDDEEGGSEEEGGAE